MATRFSALPAAELCGHALTLAEKYPAGSRRTLMGTARHSTATDADREKLTAEEREELATLAHFPAQDIVPADALFYQEEPEIALDAEGRAVQFGSEAVVSQGHPDHVWLHAGIAYVVDMKPDTERYHPLMLQNCAAGFALANLWGVEYMRLGIWGYRDAKMRWNSEGPIALDSPQAAELWRRVLFAATRDREAITGPHCGDCYQRLHCEHRLLPAAVATANGDLALMAEGGHELWSPERAIKAYTTLKALRDIEKTASETLENYLVQQGGRVAFGGHELVMTDVSGRNYADTQALIRDGLTRYVRKTKSGKRLTFRKVKG